MPKLNPTGRDVGVAPSVKPPVVLGVSPKVRPPVAPGFVADGVVVEPN